MTNRDPVRKLLTIPAKDSSTLAWLAEQNNSTFSIIRLIHEEIERNGYTDKMFPEVVQQPKRGRPPKNDEVPTHDEVPVQERTEPEPAQMPEPDEEKTTVDDDDDASALDSIMNTGR